jgi:hypothetical protein
MHNIQAEPMKTGIYAAIFLILTFPTDTLAANETKA